MQGVALGHSDTLCELRFALHPHTFFQVRFEPNQFAPLTLGISVVMCGVGLPGAECQACLLQVVEIIGGGATV
jgi:hypothetical protein